MDRLVELICRENRSLFAAPFALLGHSMGALVAFEVARQLGRTSRHSPSHLIVSGHRAPHLRDRKPVVHALPDREFLAYLRSIGGDLSAIEIDEEAKVLLLPTIRADFQLCESYRYREEAPLACPITAFGGNDDQFATPAELGEWSRHTSGQFQLHVLPGGHFFLKSAESDFLQYVEGCLQASANNVLPGPR
jgi:surfactin synthase thioesterase subunit